MTQRYAIAGNGKRYGRHKRTGKFVRWSSPYGRLLRSRRALDGQVTAKQRDQFRQWARSKSIAPTSRRIEVANPPLRLRALAEARALLGVVERGGNNRGPEVDRIIRENGGVLGEPWCGDFAAYVYRRAGSTAVTRAWAATQYIGRIGGMSSRGPRAGRRGDLVVFNFPGGHPDSDHVGLLVNYVDVNGRRVDRHLATHVKTIDGNTTANATHSDGTGADGVEYAVRPIGLVDRTVRVRR